MPEQGVGHECGGQHVHHPGAVLRARESNPVFNAFGHDRSVIEKLIIEPSRGLLLTQAGGMLGRVGCATEK
jgi:hypothetical protein